MSSAPLGFGGDGQCPPHTLPGTALAPLALNAGDRPSPVEPRLVAATPRSLARGIAPGPLSVSLCMARPRQSR